ncbi:hypothetical protein CRUP_006570, partial [Coryphaenoides rupestris]
AAAAAAAESADHSDSRCGCSSSSSSSSSRGCIALHGVDWRLEGGLACGDTSASTCGDTSACGDTLAYGDTSASALWGHDDMMTLRSSPDKEGSGSGGKKGNASPDVDEEGFSLRPGEEGETAAKAKQFFSSSDSEDEEESRRKFKIKIKPLVSESVNDRLPQNAPAFFGLPSESAYATYDVVPADAWRAESSRAPPPETSFSRGFPMGVDLPKGGGVSRSSAPIYLNIQSPVSYQDSPDEVFSPGDSPSPGDETASSRWVTFSCSQRPPPPDEPAPPPPPPESPPPGTPSSTPSTPDLSPGPPPNEPPPSPPPFSSPHPLPPSPPRLPPLHRAGPSPAEPAPPLPPDFSPPALPPACPDGEEAFDEEPHPPAAGRALVAVAPGVPSPLVLGGGGGGGGKRTPPPRDELPEARLLPRGLLLLTPWGVLFLLLLLLGPPPDRKLPPGKPIADLARPFSPPVSGSPPPFAPLARAESSSSISSITSLSAASTPTLGRDLMSNTGSSRGPSPLTMGFQDTLPVAAAFTETINAYFKGADPSKCVVKITGEIVLSFPAGITRHFASQPTQPAGSTDLRIDYKYNSQAMAAPAPLHNIHFLVPVDGGVAKLQAMIPPATWNHEQQTILWKIPSLSQRSDNGGVGALLGRFQLMRGPSKPSQLAVQFTSEGSTLSGCDIQLVGSGYRLSLVKKRFAAGKYLADN